MRFSEYGILFLVISATSIILFLTDLGAPPRWMQIAILTVGILALLASTLIFSIAQRLWENQLQELILKHKNNVSPPSKLEVNAALSELICTDAFSEPAQIVINFCFPLPAENRLLTASYRHYSRTSNTTTGYTTEAGNVSIRNKEKKIVEKSTGIEKERVGQFKIWKRVEGRLVFRHFWESDTFTQVAIEKRPETYGLDYDPITLAPISFGIWEPKTCEIRIPGFLHLTFNRYDFHAIKKSEDKARATKAE